MKLTLPAPWGSRALPFLALTLLSILPTLGQTGSIEPISRPYTRSRLALGDSGSAEFSSDGRYVSFMSNAQNITRGLGNGLLVNVFVRDLQTKSNVLISVSADGQLAGNGHSSENSISADGRLVLFTSDASNLIAADLNNASDVFLRDWQSGSTELISVSSAGEQALGASSSASMTPDGRYVIFESTAANLASGDANNGGDLFLRDRTAGQTWLITHAASGTGSANSPLSAGGYGASISDDGRFTVYQTIASNLVTGVISGIQQVYIYDSQTHSNLVVSHVSTNALGGNAVSRSPLISSNGKVVAYLSAAANLTAPTLSGTTTEYLYIYDTATGVNKRLPRPDTTTTYSGELVFSQDGSKLAYTFGSQIYVWDNAAQSNTLVTKNQLGAGANGISDSISISDDGKLLAFVSGASDLTADTTFGLYQVFVADLQNGTITLVSRSSDATSAGGVDSTFPGISGDGRFVSFQAFDGDLIEGDNNEAMDIFLANADGAAAPALVSEPNIDVASSTAAGLSTAGPNAISRDGRFVVFTSSAADIVPADENEGQDIFLRDRSGNKTLLVSADSSGAPAASGNASSPIMTPDGRFVLFTTTGALLDLDTNNVTDAYLRDTQQGKTFLVSISLDGNSAGNRESAGAGLSADGRYVLFTSSSSNLTADGLTKSADIFFRDMQLGTTVRLATGRPGGLTRDGHYAVVLSNGGSTSFSGVYDTSTGQRIYTGPTRMNFSGSFSDDGRFVLEEMTTTVPSIPQLFLFDPATGQKTLISSDGFQAAISGYGDYAAYLTSGRDPTGALVYSLQIQELVTGTETKAVDLGTHQIKPLQAFSADGSFLTFSIVGTNLTTGDLNPLGDVFLYDLAQGKLTLITGSDTQAPTPASSSGPSIDGDGGVVVFTSGDFNLVPDDLNNTIDVLAYHPSTGGPSIHVGLNDQKHLVLSWDPAAGQKYQLQSTAALPGGWSNVGQPMSSDKTISVVVDPSGLGQFYRVSVVP